MGSKLLWLGLTLIMVDPILSTSLPLNLVGAVLMVIGIILYLLNV